MKQNNDDGFGKNYFSPLNVYTEVFWNNIILKLI